MAQQESFEEAEFLHSFKAVNDRLDAVLLASLRKADAILEDQKERRKEGIPFRYKTPRREQLWEDEEQQVRYPRSLLKRRLSTLTAKESAHLSPTVGASMLEVRENQCPQGGIIHYDIMESSSLPSADGIGSIHRPVGGYSQGIGPQTNERMDACGSMETLIPCSPSVHVLVKSLEPCSQSSGFLQRKRCYYKVKGSMDKSSGGRTLWNVD